MNPAKFKTIREAIGLSISELSDIADVQPRTVRYWESGRNTPPDDIAQQLTLIDSILDSQVNHAIAIYQEKKPDEVVLYRYVNCDELYKAHPEFKGLPVTTHAAMLYRALRKFEGIGVPVSIEYK